MIFSIPPTIKVILLAWAPASAQPGALASSIAEYAARNKIFIGLFRSPPQFYRAQAFLLRARQLRRDLLPAFGTLPHVRVVDPGGLAEEPELRLRSARGYRVAFDVRRHGHGLLVVPIGRRRIPRREHRAGNRSAAGDVLGTVKAVVAAPSASAAAGRGQAAGGGCQAGDQQQRHLEGLHLRCTLRAICVRATHAG